MHGLPLIKVVLAATFSFAGAAASIGAVIAEVGGTDLGPWVSGGGAAAAVGGLVYVAKKFASGDVVAFPVADVVFKLQEQHEREDQRHRTEMQKLHDVIKDSNDREDGYRAWLLNRKVGDT
jgi:hypothetical protein